MKKRKQEEASSGSGPPAVECVEDVLSKSLHERLWNELMSTTFTHKVSTFPRKWHVSSNAYVWIADDERFVYAFSHAHRNALRPALWTPVLREVRAVVAKAMGGDHTKANGFNAVLLNIYPTGAAKLSAHEDADPWLGSDFDVASMSLGATRKIIFRRKVASVAEKATKSVKLKGKTAGSGVTKSENPDKFEYTMRDNSLVIMRGEATQREWKHEVPAAKTVTDVRFNLTFRRVHVSLLDAQRKKCGQARDADAVTLEQPFKPLSLCGAELRGDTKEKKLKGKRSTPSSLQSLRSDVAVAPS
jgi:alkylated DNA repair dioxygenase AlkB